LYVFWNYILDKKRKVSRKKIRNGKESPVIKPLQAANRTFSPVAKISSKTYGRNNQQNKIEALKILPGILKKELYAKDK
jgi:hypothetical protein